MELFVEYLRQNNISAVWLAHQIGISKQAFYKKLNGRNCFNLRQALKLKEILNLTWTEFYLFFSE